MDFDFSDEQREIKSTAHEFIASRFKPEKVRELAEADSPYDDAGAAIQAAGSDEQKSKWLPGIASGSQRGAAEIDCDPEPIVGAASGAAILVLADGRIQEDGTHEALLAQGGTYAELFQLQAAGYR